jgi:hypothetical protein
VRRVNAPRRPSGRGRRVAFRQTLTPPLLPPGGSQCDPMIPNAAHHTPGLLPRDRDRVARNHRRRQHARH